MNFVLIFLIRFYQKFFSQLKPPVCKFKPTCSQYAIEAITKFGVIKGTGKTILRIIRCNPFSKGGYDPVK